MDLGGVAKGIVVCDGVDGCVVVEVVGAEAEGHKPAQLDVVDAHLEVDNAPREARGPTCRVALEVGGARRREVVVRDLGETRGGGGGGRGGTGEEGGND
jgi:hypothetical protein